LGILNVTTHHDYKPPSSVPRRTWPVAEPPPSRAAFDDYLHSVHYLDQVLREFFAGLQTQGLLENTVVFVLGDHGEAFGEHGRIGHDDVPWEEGLRVPFLVHGPERWLGPARRITGLRQVLDVVPTIGDLLGVQGLRTWSGTAQGMSLLAEPVPERRLIMPAFNNTSTMATLRDHQKLIYFPLHDRVELYDLASDPLERRPRVLPATTAGTSEVVDEIRRFVGSVNLWYVSGR
jgi:arylsulfatase A-like enzyme